MAAHLYVLGCLQSLSSIFIKESKLAAFFFFSILHKFIVTELPNRLYVDYFFCSFSLLSLTFRLSSLTCITGQEKAINE